MKKELTVFFYLYESSKKTKQDKNQYTNLTKFFVIISIVIVL
jgi:hypothetical protein